MMDGVPEIYLSGIGCEAMTRDERPRRLQKTASSRSEFLRGNQEKLHTDKATLLVPFVTHFHSRELRTQKSAADVRAIVLLLRSFIIFQRSYPTMKFTVAALAVVASLSSIPSATHAFAPGISTAKSSFVSSSVSLARNIPTTRSSSVSLSKNTLSMSYTVGIVGATGAVGKEIRQCLEKSEHLVVEKLRIFGSSRSAGTTVESPTFGDVTVELFSQKAARECDVVFLAVSGDFALEHAKAISEGDDGAVVIDNSVRVS